MGQSMFHVDAFTDRPFAGNPAGVCVLSAPADATWMQAVAREMALSATAFLHPEGSAYALRWFGPAGELAFCGHATLASAHILWSEGHLAPGVPARFQTCSGLLTAEQCGDAIDLDFPADPPAEITPPDGLVEALGVEPILVGRNRLDIIVVVADEAIVRGVQPDMVRLAMVPTRGVIVTSQSHDLQFDFVSRFFAPAAGIPEDSVTGSAHCCLGPYWAERLGKNTLVGFQASLRGGVVHVELTGDRVKLRGQAVTVMRGELMGEADVFRPDEER